MNGSATAPQSVLITGAGGYLGRLLVKALAEDPGPLRTIVALDLRPAPAARLPGVEYVTGDVRSPTVAAALRRHAVEAVVHLAAVVTPGRRSDRALEYSVDVEGTRNVLDSCLAAGVAHLVVTTSGASYGYYADSPRWLVETDPLRGNREFAYSDHKRQVEEMLARYRAAHPQLGQLVFRPGTILGETTGNQITDIFDRPVIVGLAGCPSPFVLVWDQDVVSCLVQGLRERQTGIYNLAGDGVLTLKEMAGLMRKPYLPLPVAGVAAALGVMKRLRLTQYGPEQVNFLRYRPVLCNRALKEDFGYVPRKSTREVFDHFLRTRRTRAAA